MSSHIGIGFYGASDPRSLSDIYKSSWQNDINALDRTKSDGTAGITTSGAFNAIYGPKIFNLAYNRHNTLAAIGLRPYYTGVRFQLDLSMGGTDNPGVIRGGYRQAPKIATYATIEEPFKVNEHNFAMEFGMAAINGIDDVLKWEQQMDFEAKTWLNRMNYQVLTRIEDAPAVGLGQYPAGNTTAITSKERVGLESIERIISNSKEASFLPGSTDENGPYACPYYTATLPSSEGNAMLKYRDKDASGFNADSDNNFNSYVDQNYTAGDTTGKAEMRQLNLSMIDNMFNTCMPYWDENSTGGKVLITGYDTLTKLQALLQPQQRYQGFVAAKMTVNGISTVEGNSTGFQVAAYNGVPILPDRMVNRGDKSDATQGVGRMYLIDTEALSRGSLKETVVNVSDNPLITQSYNRVCNMYSLSEVQASGFRGLGKVIHIR